MLTHTPQLPARRPALHRGKGDENAIKRQSTALGGDGPKRFAAGAMKATRAALGEIPTAINRKVRRPPVVSGLALTYRPRRTM